MSDCLKLKNIEVMEHGNVSNVDIFYPSQDNPKFLEVAILHVRANDGFRCWFDFDRDGWVVEQPTSCDLNKRTWQEVAFLQGWALNKDSQEGII